VFVAINLEEFGIGIKGESNMELAGFPRKLSKQSTNYLLGVVKHLLSLEVKLTDHS